MNGLRQMSQRLRFDILESFFYDFARDIEWGGEDYDDTSLFDESGLAEESDTENTNELGVAAGQEAANEEEESRRQLSQPPLFLSCIPICYFGMVLVGIFLVFS